MRVGKSKPAQINTKYMGGIVRYPNVPYNIYII